VNQSTVGRVYIARHGECESNRTKRYAGFSDEGLTETGREQATILARTLAGKGLDCIRTSSLPRARETSELIGSALDLPIFNDNRLNEMSLGPWEGLTEAEIARRYPVEHQTWMDRPDELRLSGRETLSDVALRVRAAVTDSILSGRLELLVSHVAFIRVAVLLAKGRPMAEYKTVKVPNCHCFEIPTSFAQGNLSRC